MNYCQGSTGVPPGHTILPAVMLAVLNDTQSSQPEAGDYLTVLKLAAPHHNAPRRSITRGPPLLPWWVTPCLCQWI